MSLRWTSYVPRKPPRGGSKTRNGRCPSQIALLSKKVCYKVYLYENRQRHTCKAFIGYIYPCKMVDREIIYAKIWPKLTYPLQKRRFQSIFARSASAIKPSEKKSIDTNRKPNMSCSIRII